MLTCHEVFTNFACHDMKYLSTFQTIGLNNPPPPTSPRPPRIASRPVLIYFEFRGKPSLRDGPLEKWWGGPKPKKIHARENADKNNSCKEEGKEKKFMQKKGPIVTFSGKSEFLSESLSLRNQQYYQAQYE